MTLMTGTLYLIPSTLGSSETNHVLPHDVKLLATRLTHFIVEDVRSARRYLRLLDNKIDIDRLQFMVLDKRFRREELAGFIGPLLKGNDVGIISEAGCPGIADPGAEVVAEAHRAGIQVVPLVGPSSILLALMASGLNGQNFAFAGYLPINKVDRQKKIRGLELRSRQELQAQIFIETPFRNSHLFDDLISTCSASTMLCVAVNLTLPEGYVITRTVGQWKAKVPDLNKKPAIFIMQG